MTPVSLQDRNTKSLENGTNSPEFHRQMDEAYVDAISMRLVDPQGFSLELLTHYQDLSDRVPANKVEELESRFAVDLFQAYERHRNRVLTPAILRAVEQEGFRMRRETLLCWNEFEDAQAPGYSPVDHGLTHRSSL